MKVLIVVDMQNDFITGALGSEEAQKIVPKVVEKVKENKEKNTVIFTMDTHFDDYLDTLEGKNLSIPHCRMKTTGWEIIPELSLYAKKNIFKFTFGADWWDYDIDESKVEEFELCGVCTDICVISNALILRAIYPNAKITVDASCCAGTTPEKHKMALEVMKSCQIEVINE